MNRLLALPSPSSCCGPSLAADPKPVEFRLTFDKAALDRPFTGRVFVLLTKAEPTRAAAQPQLVQPGADVREGCKDWKPGEPLTVGADALAFPTPLAELKPGKYFAQAVMDRDLGGISFAASPGNVYSKPVPFEIGPKQPDAVLLSLDRVYRGAAVQGDGDRQARRGREQATDQVPRQADDAPRRGDPAAVVRQGAGPQVPGRLRDHRVRRRPHVRPGGRRPQAVGRGRRRDDLGRPRRQLPARPPRLRRLREQRPGRHRSRRGVDPAHREELPRHRRGRGRGSSPATRRAAGRACGSRSRTRTPSAAAGPRRRTRWTSATSSGSTSTPRGANLFADADGKPRRSPARSAAGRSTSSRSPTWKSSWAAAGNSAPSRRCSARAGRTASRGSSGTARPARSTRRWRRRGRGTTSA